MKNKVSGRIKSFPYYYQVSLFLILSGLVFNLRSDPLQLTYFDLSLDQLGDILITSVAKKPQKLSQAASSIYVISQEDIKRSGVTSIPDALRMVPGVQVAKLDSNKWAISIRGFNDIFSNKLLILMDGRTVYSPFFGGTHWDTVDTILEDIERIEVIRGPGGTLWGSNAVNGVINITTKNAKESSGLLVSALAGNIERGKLSIRYGGAINHSTNYRLYVKGFEKDHAEDGVDDWRMGRSGFRVDSQPSKKDKLTFQGDIYASNEGEMAISTTLGNVFPFGNFASEIEVFGGNVLFRWQRKFSEDSNLIVQTYYDRAEREHFYIKDKRDTFDLDLQHRFSTFGKQEINWGLGFRYISDETKAGTVLRLDPKNRSDEIISAFLQDEISLIEDQLILTFGSKFEHNSYSGFEYQPSARLLWKPYDQHSLWGSVSRAVKTPSRIEHDIILQRSSALRILGDRNFNSEELIAYETGYRFLDKKFTFDVSLYYNQYDNLRSLEFKPQLTTVDLVISNELKGETYGLEIASSWQVAESWRLRGGYSYTQIQLHLSSKSTDLTEEQDEGDTPHHQFSFSSFWQVTQNLQLDTTLRYVDMIKGGREKQPVDSYTTMDCRVSWQAHELLELSVIGQNLFGKHREFRGSTIDTQATDVELSVYFKADFRY